MAKKKILLVDDEPQVIDILKIKFESRDYEVISAFDGREALEKAREVSPDAIILDVVIPKRDGYKVCRMLKFDEKYKEIPVVMLTGRRTTKEDKQLGTEVGADAYVTKPFDPENVLVITEQLLGESK